MGIDFVLYLAGSIFFGLGAFNVSGLNWQNAGFCVISLALFVI